MEAPKASGIGLTIFAGKVCTLSLISESEGDHIAQQRQQHLKII
jgi:hypothetical protein